MLLAALLFSLMGVCVKLASDNYSTSEIVMARGLIGAVLLAGWIMMRGGSFRTSYGKDHFWRGALGITAVWMWFYAIANLPLATAMTLNYLSPVWMAVIVFAAAYLRGREEFDWGLCLAILTSFAGVALLLQPSFNNAQWFAGLVGLMSSALSALAYLMVKRLGQQGEPEYRVVFYFSLSGTVAGLGMIALSEGGIGALWRPQTPNGLMLLLGAGVFAAFAQVALTRAYRLGKTLVTANLQYTGIVFSSLWGVLIWNDVFGWTAWAGMALILGSGSAATFYNARKAAAVARLTDTTQQAASPESKI